MPTAYQQFVRAGFQWNHDRLVKEILKETDEQSLKEAEKLAEEVRKNTPVETGALRDSVRVEKSRFFGEGGGASVLVGDRDTYYWRFVELGAPKRGRGEYPKRRYIYKSLARKERQIEKNIKESVKDAVEKLSRNQATGRFGIRL